MAEHTCQDCERCKFALDTGGAVFDRRAKSFDGAERDWSPAEMYQLYSRGVRDGASTKAMRHPGLGPYELGYVHGRDATRTYIALFATQIGYEPSVLRTQPVAWCPTCVPVNGAHAADCTSHRASKSQEPT